MKANDKDEQTGKKFPPSMTNNILKPRDQKRSDNNIANDTEKEDEIYPEVIKPTEKIIEPQKKAAHDAPENK